MSRQRWTWVDVPPSQQGSYPLPPIGGWTTTKPLNGWWYEGEEPTAPPPEIPGGTAYYWAKLVKHG